MPEKPSNTSKKLPTDAYKGVRDFFPEDMAIQSYIFSVWRKAAESFGYEEYGASVLEPAELYRTKSGDEIVNEQTYTFADRGKREVTLRPEMTPTVARMVAAKRRELGLPLRWYSIPNLFRYEQPQRGRVREHWQLNVDMFGVDSIEADVEIISLAYQVMKDFGAKDRDFEIRVNDISLLPEILMKEFNTDKEGARRLIKTIDRDVGKRTDEKVVEKIDAKFGTGSGEKLAGLLKGDWSAMVSDSERYQALKRTRDRLVDGFGLKNIKLYPFLTRGFDYYTDIIFEIYDTDPANRRSLFGGGRYDDLTSLFGGDTVPAVGFGMGDVTIRDFLETHGLLPQIRSRIRLHICTLDARFIPDAQRLAAKLRDKGIAVSVNLTDKKVGDQISWADKHHIANVIVMGEQEASTGTFKLKALATQEEKEVSEQEIADALKS